MLYCDKIDISEGIDPTKSSISKEFMICHYWFFNHGFEFQDSLCNDCHDLTILCLNISDVAVITIKSGDYCGIIHNISKSEAFIRKLCACTSWVYIKNIVLIFSLLKAVFLFTFLFCYI